MNIEAKIPQYWLQHLAKTSLQAGRSPAAHLIHILDVTDARLVGDALDASRGEDEELIGITFNPSARHRLKLAEMQRRLRVTMNEILIGLIIISGTPNL